MLIMNNLEECMRNTKDNNLIMNINIILKQLKVTMILLSNTKNILKKNNL